MQGASSKAVYPKILSQAAFDCLHWGSVELYSHVGFNKVIETYSILSYAREASSTKYLLIAAKYLSCQRRQLSESRSRRLSCYNLPKLSMVFFGDSLFALGS